VIITASTMATKQHVVVDVLAGVALGLCGALPGPRARLEPSAVLSVWNRLNLALAASIAAKLTILVLGIEWSHQGWAVAIFVAPDLWILGGLLLPNSAAVMPLATRFRTARREVWLTIDDGPEPATQPAMLDLLDRHRARATFFLIGEKARARPALVAEIVRRGHTLGNHTQTHPLATFWRAGPYRTAREIEDCDAALRAAGAGPSPWFRAPAGVKNLALRRALDRRQRVLVGWSARGREVCSPSPEVSLRRLTKRLASGSILLMHESDRQAADRIALLSQLLEHLSAAGYTCVLPARDDLC
jgi:peptidoglycan/xylan/chitin deacetylase (PgdA/CDA1 family)